jgi:hypothetical protein
MAAVATGCYQIALLTVRLSVNHVDRSCARGSTEDEQSLGPVLSRLLSVASPVITEKPRCPTRRCIRHEEPGCSDRAEQLIVA